MNARSFPKGAGSKALAVFFGLVMGALAFVPAYYFLVKKPEGTSFESLEDLRHAMLRPEKKDADGSLNLGGIVNPHPSDKIIYDLRPNLDVRFQRQALRTNSCGMRSPERSIEKPENTYRIVFLGDSFTFGWGVKAEESFPSILEDNLNRLSDGTRTFEVINMGVPGYSTFQEVAKFIETGLDFNPDEVVVYFIRNDFGLPFYVKNILNPGKELLDSGKFAKLSWRKDNDAIEQQRLQLLGYDPNTALQELSDVTRRVGIPLKLVINPKKGWKVNRDGLRILRKRPDIQLLALRKSFMELYTRRQIDEAALTLPHDPHPSALRHKMLGDLLTPYFMEAL